MVTTGILLITFNKSASADVIEAVVDQFYTKNKTTIEKMEYTEFKDPEILIEVSSYIRGRDVRKQP